MNNDALSIWVIYDHPNDHPKAFVARRWLMDGLIKPTDDLLSADTLDELRANLPAGFTPIPRSDEDDPVIVETWV